MRLLGLLLLPVGLLALVSCEESEGEAGIDYEFEVDCTAMTIGTPLVGTQIVSTLNYDRCVGLISDTLWAEPGQNIDLIVGEQVLAVPQNSITLLINYGGATWVPQEGTFTVDGRAEGLVEGTYEVLATSSDAPGVAKIRGRFQWCSFGTSTECPHVTDGGLSKVVEYVDPANYPAGDETYASECRVLIDPPTGGVQVDLEIGVFRGVNVTAWSQFCQQPYMVPGSFSFRSGGVTGPGTYGPFTTRQMGAYALPEVSLSYPIVWYSHFCENDYGFTSSVSSVVDQTECSFTIEENPGRFSVSCTGASRQGRSSFNVGDFDLSTDCDVRYTE